jgi:hypothetical protein
MINQTSRIFLLLMATMLIISSCSTKESTSKSSANDKSPSAMVLISAGDFLMGGKSEQAS